MSPRPALGRRRAPSGTELHRSWLALVDTEGPFLTLPVLLRVWPQANFPGLDSRRLADLKVAKASFEAAHDAHATGDLPLHAFRGERDAWVEHVLRDTFGWGDHLVLDEAVHTTVASPTGAITATSTAAFRRGDDIAALVWVVDPVDSLRSIGTDGWATDTIDRFELMLRASHTPVGVVTDGRWWGLVSAQRDPKTGTSIAASSGIVDAFDWVNDPAARDALAALLAAGRVAGGQPEDRLAALFRESVTSAELVTEALGAQVRRAVELIVQAFSESALDAVRRGEPDPLPEDAGIIYDAAVTVMMRVVFLLFAEERGLLPSGELFRGSYGLTGQLDELRSRAQVETPEGLDATSAVWHRLLATSRALYRGASFEDLRLPTYGGSLFDPERFPFLATLTPTGELALAVDDRVMMQVLDAVQMADVKGERRPISFRDIDVEQIGYIYEGLLGYTCRRAPQTLIGLIGKAGAEAEIPLSVLNDLYEDNPDDRAVAGAILAWVKTNQPSATTPTVGQLTKALAAGDTMKDADLALRAVTHDPELAGELRGWLGIIRRDLRHRPTVITKGGLVVVETPSRKNAGAHYTPRSLAEEVVLHALEPLVYQPGPHQTADRTAWVLKSPEDILELKVADISCGSGAFLVAAARYLAARLVEAWDRRGSGLGTAEQQKTKALREVVARCLYGADINPMAIEMCKLSLWLVSLDPKLPFSFVDDKVLVGNSLLGITDLDQVRRLHIDPSRATNSPALFEVTSAAVGTNVDVDAVMARALRLRQELASEVNNDDPQRSAHTKAAQLVELRAVTAQVRDLADGVVAAGLRSGGKPGKALDEAYADLRVAATDAYPAEGEANRTMLDDILEAGLTPTVETDYQRWQPLHWPIALPDVFARGGFDAVIGNPPFLGGKKISPANGSNVRLWLANQLARSSGNGDLVAYFFLRASVLLAQSGTLGLIATNTVAQGDTREVGLDQMVAGGLTITRSIQSRSWPSSSANLEYAAVWGTRGRVASDVPAISDDIPVRRITTLLEPVGRAEGRPHRLGANGALAFQGCIVLGMGFVIDPSVAAHWIELAPRNNSVLAPYLNGEDLNSRPDGSAARWVIDFNERSDTAAASFTEPWAHVVLQVKPERVKKDAARYPRMVNEWWKFWNSRPALRAAVSGLSEVLAIALVSKTVMPLRVPTGQVFSHALGVFATDSFAQQAVLSSSLHQMWAIKYGSGMRKDPRYTPSDVFETFPRPDETDALRVIGRTLDEERREIMLRRDLGLTKLYNLVNDPSLPDASDPDVARLRAIHVELDEAVMAAYGWSDVSLDHGFHAYRQMTRWTISPSARVEILDRLLEENHRRAAAEAAGGMGAAPTASDAEDDFDPDAEEDEA